MRQPIGFTITVLLALLLGPSPVAAHSEVGLLALEATPAAGQLQVKVSADLVYANDRDPVSSATVTVEGTGPNRATLAATPLASQGGGVYTAVITLPVAGAWTLRATSVGPEASAETHFAVQKVSFDTTTTTTTSTTSPSTTSATEPAHADASVDSGGGGGWAVVVGGVVLVGALAAAAMWLRARRRSTA